ncbi:MAG: DUF748 domain-containing protein, partial [Planctomycetales bacterium]|nr:DUF748 domain-containing protein [Planctomycetales bacterium]NIM09687.1 DUF748 domain-containing protein [Planctomycetales bacterium]NIN09166.1 DUF748 domain-containing protein [Planctomycetales bacterium]NIN78271.1 DUF748 domain-containing protein [Planctomycetales bacterium]NIO35462.1 DUF748 domain-containing protein [Planctomycetales bacterium]
MARDDERRAGSSGRRRFAALVLSCGLVALVWFAPQITARTGLCDRIVPLLLPDYPGQIRFATPRLGWLTPVQLNRFQATDAAGQLVLEADRIRSSRHLLDLVLRGTRGLDLHLYRPRLVCRSRPDGSNLEDTLQGLPGSADRGKGFDRLTLRVEDGVVELHDDQAGLQGRLNDLQLTCQVETDGGPLRISLASRVTATDNSSGDLSAQVEFAPPAAAGDARFSSGSAALKSQQVPLAALQPLLRRFGAPAQISGRLAADVESSWELAGEMPRLDLQGHVGGTRWRVVPPRWLGPQPLQLAGIHSVADIRWEAGQLHVRHCNLDSDLAQFKLQGRLDVDGLWQDGSSLLLTEHDWQLQGRLNLAQLAAQLPQLLRLREDTQVTAGELVVDLTARTDPQARHWEGKLATSDLQATSGGRTLRWARPIEMTLNLHRPIDGELQGRLACHSDFLQVDAEGSASRATVAVQGNLDRLASHIRQLMDLGDLQLAGTWNAGLELDRRTDGQFTANGHALFEDFQLEYPGRRPLREQRLTLALDTSGMADRQGIAQLQHATLRLGSAGDQLNLQLRSPVARPLAQAAWPLSLKLQGQLASWLPRLQPWLPFSGWQVAGGVRLQATASLAADEAVIEQAKLTLQQLQASNGQLNIREPQVLLVTAGKWKRATGAIESDLTTLASGSLAIRADRVSIRLPSEDSRPNVQGALAVQADLASLQSWLARGPQGPQTRYAG